MTEDEAREATRAIVGDAALAKFDHFADRVRVESDRQNLVSRPSLDALWHRHMLDSAQLIPLAPPGDGLWIDVGTGAGFPGIVVALAAERPFALVEPRRMRADFLREIVAEHGISHRVTIHQSKVERLPPAPAAVISARAVASISDLLDATAHLANGATVYLLPKGQSATTEQDDARRRFEGMFHVEQSITDPNSGIIVASNVRRRR
ncbi:16S rRNA (guanine(527)-N(7))-methyltransferase RsmG [Sphingomonas radiodurans]|uniref:16S rRNA (guanine(527)-N(7))-methyltransferase RsmG n=1 Tax=Sphingomonas radiodurans TaxID=2890321 RepID=UPI001E3CAAE2|nr:16S rRNA (guanine(527)-N(7))-methyltransferase RsmG [Sphingomonas radiodurans]WBH18106.1 16S rRNA (guanine(527)-N(7))-methyltransferase RsmG [Sphingomonas radiodurans]